MGTRTEITALRALAVALVVAVHALGQPGGGWSGVDVFFVLSGYLIARSLVQERLRAGSVDLLAFFRRRFWRLFPAAGVTLFVVAVGAAVALRRPIASSVASDAGSAALGFVNWVFLARDADYWASASSTSPLQHFWSLSVELQFYVVFPLALVAAWRWSRRTGTEGARRTALIVSAVLLAASVVWAVVQGMTEPSAAYFDTRSRLWELAAGACAGVLSTGRGNRSPSRGASWRAAGVVVGFAIIGLAAVIGPSAGAVPFPDAVPAIVGTLLVVVCGQGLGALPVLRWRPVQWVGDASYSIYLWHFPVVVAAAYALPDHRLIAGVGAVVVGVLLGGLSRRWVEVPGINVRHGRRSTRTTTVAVASLAVVALTVGSAVPGDTCPPGARTTAVGWDHRTLRAALHDGLEADRWPGGLTPGLDALLPGPLPGYETCDWTDISDPEACRFSSGIATRTVVVVGSSVGVALMPAARGAFARDSVVRGLTASGCPMLELEVRGKSADDRRRCARQRAAAVREINSTKPDIVVVTHSYDGVSQLVGKPSIREAGRAWEAAAREFTGAVGPSGARVVFIGAVPEGKAVAQCAALRNSGPGSCVSGLSSAYRTGAAAERRAAESTARAEYIDSSDWYCVDDRCPVIADDVLVRRDGQHLTEEFSRRLAPVLRQAVLG
uniref:Acyltransferase n=1 Tax=Neobacillus citreus TaxID=2833578 RepID=A0A942SWK0_9BACI